MDRSDEFSRIREIAEAICDGEVNESQKEELKTLISTDIEAQRYYIEYMDMHARMLSEGSSDLQPIIKDGQLEFVLNEPSSIEVIGEIEEEKRSWTGTVIAVFIILVLLILLIWQFTQNKQNSNVFGTLHQGSGLIQLSDKSELQAGDIVTPGKYEVDTNDVVILTENKKGHLNLIKQTEIELLNANEIKLLKGELDYKNDGESSLTFHTSSAVINLSKNSSFSLNISPNGHRLQVHKGIISVTPAKWLPRHYWSFDSTEERIEDSIDQAHGIAGSGTKKTTGLIGPKAIHFDNSTAAHIHVGSGGGTALGTGSFAVTNGITIEAMIKPEWTAEAEDYDEIFRKDYDKAYRLLLSFQNDYPKNERYSFPKNTGPGERLSFGLYLVGHNYQELELTLDGKDGRPGLNQLKDGKAHHIVASYNSRTGIKAIYVDGKPCMNISYPPGTRIISGGPGGTTIGNIPGNINDEAFNGVIDEVAFYDFALTEHEIKSHYQNVVNGQNYFKQTDLKRPAKEWKREFKISAGETVDLDPDTGLIH